MSRSFLHLLITSIPIHDEGRASALLEAVTRGRARERWLLWGREP